MTEKELRVGNLFSYSKHNNIEQVYKIEFERMDGYAINGIPIDHIKPIPLTEEWLRKFGFEIKHVVYLFTASINYLQFEVQPKTLIFDCIKKDLWRLKMGDIEIQINFVHELQNLFFAITGNELEIAQPI